MRFSIDQALPGDIDAVLAALLDPEFLRCLGDLPNLAPPTVLGQERTGDVVVQRVHYTFTGSLSTAVTRVVDPNKLTWVVETTYDVTARRATFQIIPDHYGTKLRCSGEHSFIARGDVTIRRVEAELTVAVPLLGRVVERAITSGLRDHLQTEADLLTEFLEVNG